MAICSTPLSMKIDLKAWRDRIECLAESHLPGETVISDDPPKFFDGFFCEIGYPGTPDYFPIWLQDGVVIYIDSGQTFTFELNSGRWKKFNEAPCLRVFWISEDGVLGEVDESNGSVQEFFPVSSPEAVVEYVGLVCGKQLGRGGKPKLRVVPMNEVVEQTCVRFFRYPDDLSLNEEELPWVSTRSLKEVVELHISKSVPWLSPITKDLSDIRLKEQIKREDETHKTILLEDTGEKVSPIELALKLGEAFTPDTEDIRDACRQAANGLADDDMIAGDVEWRIQQHHLAYIFEGPVALADLVVGAILSPDVFPDYVLPQVNPSAWDEIRNYSLMPFWNESKTRHDVEVALPSPIEQRKLAFESLAYRHGINKESAQLSQFQEGKESARDLHGLLANRYEEVRNATSRLPKHDAESERARHPLPYFIEAPLIAWERSPEAFEVQNGFIAFGNLLRQIALLGLCELQAVRASGGKIEVPDKDLLSGIGGNPSLGHWSRCLDWLHSNTSVLQLFGDWVRIFAEQRKKTIELVELRNKHAHAATILERSFIEHIHRALAEYFHEVVPEMRKNDNVRIFLPNSRKAIRTDNGTVFQFTGYDLASAFSRFHEVDLELPAENSKIVVEGELLAMRARTHARVVPLNSFYRAKELTPDRLALLIYEKGCKKSEGVFSAVDIEGQQKLPMTDAPLDFL